MTYARRRRNDRVPVNMSAELFVDSDTFSARILNLSTGGMLIGCAQILAPGQVVGLGVRLDGDLKRAAGLDFLHFDLEVLETHEVMEYGVIKYRCKTIAENDSPVFLRARDVVAAAL